MDRQFIHDHQVIERYLRGALPPDEEKRFEEAYLADPELLDEIELVERLQQGLKAFTARGATTPRRASPVWLRIMTSPQYAAAASVLLAVTLVLTGTLYRENLDLRDSGGLTAVPTRTVPLFALRGDGGNVVPAAERVDVLTILALDPGVPEYDTYRATVRRLRPEGTEVVASLDGLVVGYPEMVGVGVPGRLLGPGNYEVELEGRMQDWTPDRGYELVSRIPFTTEAPE